jgi:hypothetical protein
VDSETFDPASLFGCEVVSVTGRRLGRVIALIHRADGCDVLVERRHWLRRTGQRFDLDDLVQVDRFRFCYRPTLRAAAGGPGDDRVA